MLGQEVPIGTGSVDILFDEDSHQKWLSNIKPLKKIIFVKGEIKLVSFVVNIITYL